MQSTEFVTREARDTDVEQLFASFGRRFAPRMVEHLAGECVFLVAELGDQVVGHVTVRWRSAYPYFREHGIPEINDTGRITTPARWLTSSSMRLSFST